MNYKALHPPSITIFSPCNNLDLSEHKNSKAAFKSEGTPTLLKVHLFANSCKNLSSFTLFGDLVFDFADTFGKVPGERALTLTPNGPQNEDRVFCHSNYPVLRNAISDWIKN